MSDKLQNTHINDTIKDEAVSVAVGAATGAGDNITMADTAITDGAQKFGAGDVISLTPKFSIADHTIDEIKSKFIYEYVVPGYLYSYEIEDMLRFDTKPELFDSNLSPEKIREADEYIAERIAYISKQCELAKEQRENDYQAVIALYKKNKEKAAELFKDIKLAGYKNSPKYINSYKNQTNEMDEPEMAKSHSFDFAQKWIDIKAFIKNHKKSFIAYVTAICLLIGFAFLVYPPSRKYVNAVDLYINGKSKEAIAEFKELGDFEHSKDFIKESK